MNRQNDLHPFLFEGSIHTGVVIACCDTFCQTLTKKPVVVIDNASIHTSEEFEDRLPYWKKKGKRSQGYSGGKLRHREE
jgi:hypothetical protein